MAIFPCYFKTNAMLLTAKSFSFIDIKATPLPPKKFTILTRKIKPGEPWKVTGVKCQYWQGF